MTPTDQCLTLSPTAEAMRDYLFTHGPGTSFVELEGALAEIGVEPAGNFGIITPALPEYQDENILIWVGVSEAFCDAFREVHRADLIRFDSAGPLTYLIDGKVPNLPIVKRPPKGGYRDPHWLPLTLAPKKPGEPKEARP